MKRLFVLMFVVAIAISIPLFHDVFAAKKENVNICHATGVIADGLLAEEGGNCINFLGIPIPEGDICGVRISVNGNAARAHCAHGDRGTNAVSFGACRLDRPDIGGVCLDED